MQRVRIGIVGAGTLTEWAILPALSGPDAAAPPDSGAWWSRRPAFGGDIRYQPPARPEVVALCDAEPGRAERVASAARVRAVYTDWRLMLREVPLDALLLCGLAAPSLAELSPTLKGLRALWISGPPAVATSSVAALHHQWRGRRELLWCAAPLRHAAAHRAARRLIEEKQIGDVSALTLRWSGAFCLDEISALCGTAESTSASTLESTSSTAREAAARFASTYAALDLLLAMAARPAVRLAVPARVVAARGGEAITLWLQLADGATASALFAPADTWNRALPVMEICGSQGRSLVCEGGRRLWLHQPRQAAHLLEPPGLAPYVSTANLLGVAEDLKAFLAACAEETAPRLDLETARNASPLWPDAARVLALWEAARASIAGAGLVEIAPPMDAPGAASISTRMASPPAAHPTLSLPL